MINVNSNIQLSITFQEYLFEYIKKVFKKLNKIFLLIIELLGNEKC